MPMSPHTDAGALLKLERAAFIEAHRHLDLTEDKDGWGQPKFMHSHVDAIWAGWMTRALRQAASHGSAGGERPEVRSEDAAKVAADLQELMDVIEAVRGGRGLLRVSGTLGEPSDVGVLGIERFNDLMIRAIDALAIPTLAQAAKHCGKVREVLGAFYKTVDVMKSARNKPDHLMCVWADDMKAIEDVMFFLENLRDSGAPQPRGEPAHTKAAQPVGSPNTPSVPSASRGTEA